MYGWSPKNLMFIFLPNSIKPFKFHTYMHQHVQHQQQHYLNQYPRVSHFTLYCRDKMMKAKTFIMMCS
jgi:hypothetical protein